MKSHLKGLQPSVDLILPDGSWALVERPAEGGCITHMNAGGRVLGVLARTGRPNGLGHRPAGRAVGGGIDGPALFDPGHDGWRD